jgi:hypothetical protein
MARQLVLLDTTPDDWKLDDATRTTGRRGVAAARAALAGRPRHVGDDTHRPAA